MRTRQACADVLGLTPTAKANGVSPRKLVFIYFSGFSTFILGRNTVGLNLGRTRRQLGTGLNP